MVRITYGILRFDLSPSDEKARSGCSLRGVGGRRSPHRRPVRAWRSAAVSCAIASALLLVSVAAATPQTRFVSKRYRYSIVLPGGSNRWLSSLATVNWTSGSIEHGSPEFDTFTDLQTGRFYFLADRPSGSSLQQWTAFVISARPSPVCGAPRSLPNSTLGGSRARVLTWSCADGYRVFVITALHAHRGYVMLVASLTTLSRGSDLRAFDAAQRSFRYLST
jgi:hypothetical protein